MSHIIGVDVGGTLVRVAARGASTPPTIAPTPRDLGRLPDTIVALVEQVDPDPTAVGVGCAGLVDHPSGVVRWMPHAAGRDAELGVALASRWGVPTWIDNDANAAALAEARTGAGTGTHSVLTVTIGTGIGAGLVVGGVLQRGRGHLGEVGHMRVTDGPVCSCGRSGCWEEVASGRALDRAAASLAPGADGRWLIARAAAGDDVAVAAVDEVSGWLAIGIANLALVLDPDIIVLGGIVPVIGEVVFAPVTRHLASTGGSLAITGMPPVVLAAHGDRAGLEGAMIGAEEVMA